MIFFGTKGESENSVGPLEVYATNVEISFQWIKVEEVVFDSPRVVFLPRINDNSITTQIRQISEGLVAFVRVHIDDLKYKKFLL